MTSKPRENKAVPVVRTGKPLAAEAVNRAIARLQRDQGRNNLGGLGGALSIAPAR